MKRQHEAVDTKLAIIRTNLDKAGAGALRLRGADWFAWATAGGSSSVLLTSETGVAELLVTREDAWVLTDAIEAERLGDEELPGQYKLHASPWAEPEARERFVMEATGGQAVLSDRPSGDERPIPAQLAIQKLVLTPAEVEHYHLVGRLTAEALTEVLNRTEPAWTGYQLAGAAAAALWRRGLQPALVLAGGEKRLSLYRHPTPAEEPLGKRAMLVVCARDQGLYACLTRFVRFTAPDTEQLRREQHIREIEAAALTASRPGVTLDVIYRAIKAAYEARGYADAIRQHHQGGITGYRVREVIATPSTTQVLGEGMALAWNPSLTGTKIEDTFVIGEDGRLQNLTFDPAWPNTEVEGRPRPLPLVIT